MSVSPVPIIAVILMLLGKRAGSTSIGFATAWLVGILTATVIFVIVGGVSSSSDDGPSATSSWIKIVLGLLLLAVGVRQWRVRTGEHATPAWMAAIDGITAAKAVAIGFALAAVNPKNLIMCAAAGVTIGAGSLGTNGTIVAVVVFSALAAVTVVAPVLAYQVASSRLRDPLARLEQWLQDNNATVMSILILVIGVMLLGRGIGELV